MRRSDLIRNSFSTGPQSQITVAPKVGIVAAIVVGLRAQSRLPGTEFLGAETKRQKSPLKCANVRGDQNPGSEWPEIPAETPYLALYRKRAFCKDWMVEAVGHKLATHHPVIEPVSGAEPGTEICDAETGTQKPTYHLAETNPETRREREKPPFLRNKYEKADGSLSPSTGWWCAQSYANPSPCYSAKTA